MKNTALFFRPFVLIVGAWLLVSALPLRASEMTLPVDTTNSSLEVTLCVNPGFSPACDSDSANVTGWMVVSLDNNAAPGQVAIQNFDFAASRNLSLNLSWVLGLAQLDVTATNLGLSHADPGPQNPIFPVTADSFTATDLPINARGQVNYTANEMACTALQASGQPCSGAYDLSTYGPVTNSSAPGMILITNGIVFVHMEIAATNYLSETNPSLGTISMQGNINLSAPLLFIDRGVGSATLRWSSSALGFTPSRTQSLTPPIQWEPVPGTVNDDGAWRTLPVLIDSPCRFYRLQR